MSDLLKRLIFVPYLNRIASNQIDKSPNWYFWFNTLVLCPCDNIKLHWLHMQYFYYHAGFYIKINFPGPVLCKFYTCMLFICGNPSGVFENHLHWSLATGENWILLSQSSCGLLQRHLFSSGSQKISHFSCLREIPGYLTKLCDLLLTHRNKFPM